MENITKGNDKNEIINFVNSNDQSINSNNLNKKTYENVFDDDDFDIVEWYIRSQSYGLCPECNQPIPAGQRELQRQRHRGEL